MIGALFDFLISFELGQSIDRPNGCRNPSNYSNLKYQADEPCDRAADGKKLQPRQDDGE